MRVDTCLHGKAGGSVETRASACGVAKRAATATKRNWKLSRVRTTLRRSYSFRRGRFDASVARVPDSSLPSSPTSAAEGTPASPRRRARISTSPRVSFAVVKEVERMGNERQSPRVRPLGVSRERERVGKKKPKPIAVSDASPGSPGVGTPTRRPRRTKTARHYGTPPPTARTFMISSYVSSSTSTVVMTSSTSPRIMFKC